MAVLNTRAVLQDLAIASKQGCRPLSMAELTDVQKQTLRVVLGDSWGVVGEDYNHDNFTIRFVEDTTTGRYLEVMERLVYDEN